MSVSLPLFPVLTKEKRHKIRFTVIEDYKFLYQRDGEAYLLTSDETYDGSGIYKIIDDRGNWNPNEDNLCITRLFYFSNTSSLFGADGLACSNAVIGVALMWTSADSKQRGVIPIGEIINNNNTEEFDLEYEFNRAQLRGRIDVKTILYIKKSGVPEKNEMHLANQSGYVLGEIDHNSILIDGSGSVFPIYEISDPNQTLWYVQCNWDDPTYDSFSESIELVINRAHKNFKYLDRTKRTFNVQLMNEIMAQTLLIIVSKVKDDPNYWEDTINGNNLQKGSVSEAVSYFINTLGWDTLSPETLSISIHKFFDRKVQDAD